MVSTNLVLGLFLVVGVERDGRRVFSVYGGSKRSLSFCVFLADEAPKLDAKKKKKKNKKRQQQNMRKAKQEAQKKIMTRSSQESDDEGDDDGSTMESDMNE